MLYANWDLNSLPSDLQPKASTMSLMDLGRAGSPISVHDHSPFVLLRLAFRYISFSFPADMIVLTFSKQQVSNVIPLSQLQRTDVDFVHLEKKNKWKTFLSKCVSFYSLLFHHIGESKLVTEKRFFTSLKFDRGIYSQKSFFHSLPYATTLILSFQPVARTSPVSIMLL